MTYCSLVVNEKNKKIFLGLPEKKIEKTVFAQQARGDKNDNDNNY